MTETKPGLPSLYDPWRRAIQGQIRGARTAVVDSYTRGPPCYAVVSPLVAERTVTPGGETTWTTLPPVRLPVRWEATGGAVFTLGDLQQGDLVEIIVRDVPHGEVEAGATEAPIEPVAATRWNLSDAYVVARMRAIPAEAVSASGPVLWMQGGDVFMVGAAGATIKLAREDYVDRELDKVHTALSGHVHAAGTYTAPSGGGSVTGASGSASTWTVEATGSDRIKVDG